MVGNPVTGFKRGEACGHRSWNAPPTSIPLQGLPACAAKPEAILGKCPEQGRGFGGVDFVGEDYREVCHGSGEFQGSRGRY